MESSADLVGVLCWVWYLKFPHVWNYTHTQIFDTTLSVSPSLSGLVFGSHAHVFHIFVRESCCVSLITTTEALVNARCRLGPLLPYMTITIHDSTFQMMYLQIVLTRTLMLNPSFQLFSQNTYFSMVLKYALYCIHSYNGSSYSTGDRLVMQL